MKSPKSNEINDLDKSVLNTMIDTMKESADIGAYAEAINLCRCIEDLLSEAVK